MQLVESQRVAEAFLDGGQDRLHHLGGGLAASLGAVGLAHGHPGAIAQDLRVPGSDEGECVDARESVGSGGGEVQAGVGVPYRLGDIHLDAPQRIDDVGELGHVDGDEMGGGIPRPVHRALTVFCGPET